MVTVQEFYAPSHRGNYFGEKDPRYYGPLGHRGFDINRWARGTIIPAFRAGVVIGNYWNGALGNVLVTRDSRGDRFGYAHMDERSPLLIGALVNVGDPIGPVGGTGSLSDGDHVHVTVSETSDRPESGATKDPLPYILAALNTTQTAGTFTPIYITQEDDDMGTIYYKPTNNSSPLADRTSRIWAGRRVIDNIDFSDVWGIADNGEGRRITRKHWEDLYAIAQAKGVTLPVIECTGNELEILMYARRY